MKFKPFIGPTDSDDMRNLKQRCVCALRYAARGRVENIQSAMLAGHIDYLRVMRQRQHGLTPAGRKLIEAWLAPALLEAAEQGALLEVAQLLDHRRRNGAILNRGQYRVVVAYINILENEKRRPLIAELLAWLGIDKPKRTKENSEQWFRLDRRERMIRKTLKKFDLPLSVGKRGRRIQTSPQKNSLN